MNDSGKSQSSVNNEIKEVLKSYGGNLGDIFNDREAGNSDKELADKYGSQAYTYLAHLRAILGEESTSGARIMGQSAAAIRNLINKSDFSDEVQEVLKYRLDKCEKASEDPNALERQDKKDIEEFEKIKTSSIYAYTYPHYLKHSYLPQDEEENIMKDRTLIKLGMTTQATIKRIMQQRTGMPENPIYLLGWKVNEESADELKEIENKFHRHLRAIGHQSKKGIGGGSEWFLTNVDTLVSTADLIGIENIHDYRKSDGE